MVQWWRLLPLLPDLFKLVQFGLYHDDLHYYGFYLPDLQTAA